MPTLALVFKEPSSVHYPRRSQLKFKLNKGSEEITQDDIEKLKNEFSTHSSYHFNYGPLRSTYVSTDKVFKNIMYTATKEEATSFYQFIYPIVGHTFDKKNLSFTEGLNRAIFNIRTKF